MLAELRPEARSAAGRSADQTCANDDATTTTATTLSESVENPVRSRQYNESWPSDHPVLGTRNSRRNHNFRGLDLSTTSGARITFLIAKPLDDL